MQEVVRLTTTLTPEEQFKKAHIWHKVCTTLNVDPKMYEARNDVIMLMDGAASDLTRDGKLPGGITHLIDQLDLRTYLGPTYDEDPTKVLNRRFEKEVAVHNHRQICKFTSPIPPEKLVTEEVRIQRIDEYGYWLLHGFRVLTHIGFWKAFGLDDPSHATSLNANTFNVLNGGAQVDYEAAFPEAKEVFDLIAAYKFHAEPNKAREGRSALSVPDIILGVILTRGVEALPMEDRRPALEASARILDTRVSNAERVALYQLLDEKWKKANGSVAILQGLLSSMSDSGLARPENRFKWTLDSEEGWKPDVILPLHGGDCEGAAYAARSILLPKFPMAFITPIGFHAPHQAQSLGIDRPSYSEAQAMVAALLEKECADRFGGYPDSPPRAPSRPVRTYDILPSISTSTDTVTNVKEAATVLHALQREYKRPLNVLLVTSHHHAQRAAVEFSTGLPKELAHVRSWTQPTPAVMSRVGNSFKPVAIGNIFCELVKRLYGVCVA